MTPRERAARPVEIMLNTATGATRLVSNLCDYRLPFHLARAACALLLGLIFWQPGLAHAQATACETYRITGYVRGAHSPWTYDGTSVWTQEPIAAASWNVPINSVVQVEGTGVFRVADRGGGLSARHIDILVNSRAEALAITGWRQVCMLKSGHAKPTVNARPVNRATQTLGPIPR